MELRGNITTIGKSFKSSTFYIVNMATVFYKSKIDSFQIILQWK